MTVTLVVASGGAIAFLLTFLAALIKEERGAVTRISLKSETVNCVGSQPEHAQLREDERGMSRAA
jgi:hypothetical protein